VKADEVYWSGFFLGSPWLQPNLFVGKIVKTLGPERRKKFPVNNFLEMVFLVNVKIQNFCDLKNVSEVLGGLIMGPLYRPLMQKDWQKIAIMSQVFGPPIGLLAFVQTSAEQAPQEKVTSKQD